MQNHLLYCEPLYLKFANGKIIRQVKEKCNGNRENKRIQAELGEIEYNHNSKKKYSFVNFCRDILMKKNYPSDTIADELDKYLENEFFVLPITNKYTRAIRFGDSVRLRSSNGYYLSISIGEPHKPLLFVKENTNIYSFTEFKIVGILNEVGEISNEEVFILKPCKMDGLVGQYIETNNVNSNDIHVNEHFSEARILPRAQLIDVTSCVMFCRPTTKINLSIDIFIHRSIDHSRKLKYCNYNEFNGNNGTLLGLLKIIRNSIFENINNKEVTIALKECVYVTDCISCLYGIPGDVLSLSSTKGNYKQHMFNPIFNSNCSSYSNLVGSHIKDIIISNSENNSFSTNKFNFLKGFENILNKVLANVCKIYAIRYNANKLLSSDSSIICIVANHIIGLLDVIYDEISNNLYQIIVTNQSITLQLLNNLLATKTSTYQYLVTLLKFCYESIYESLDPICKANTRLYIHQSNDIFKLTTFDGAIGDEANIEINVDNNTSNYLPNFDSIIAQQPIISKSSGILLFEKLFNYHTGSSFIVEHSLILKQIYNYINKYIYELIVNGNILNDSNELFFVYNVLLDSLSYEGKFICLNDQYIIKTNNFFDHSKQFLILVGIIINIISSVRFFSSSYFNNENNNDAKATSKELIDEITKKTNAYIIDQKGSIKDVMPNQYNQISPNVQFILKLQDQFIYSKMIKPNFVRLYDILSFMLGKNLLIISDLIGDLRKLSNHPIIIDISVKAAKISLINNNMRIRKQKHNSGFYANNNLFVELTYSHLSLTKMIDLSIYLSDKMTADYNNLNYRVSYCDYYLSMNKFNSPIKTKQSKIPDILVKLDFFKSLVNSEKPYFESQPKLSKNIKQNLFITFPSHENQMKFENYIDFLLIPHTFRIPLSTVNRFIFAIYLIDDELNNLWLILHKCNTYEIINTKLYDIILNIRRSMKAFISKILNYYVYNIFEIKLILFWKKLQFVDKHIVKSRLSKIDFGSEVIDYEMKKNSISNEFKDDEINSYTNYYKYFCSFIKELCNTSLLSAESGDAFRKLNTLLKIINTFLNVCDKLFSHNEETKEKSQKEEKSNANYTDYIKIVFNDEKNYKLVSEIHMKYINLFNEFIMECKNSEAGTRLVTSIRL